MAERLTPLKLSGDPLRSLVGPDAPMAQRDPELAHARSRNRELTDALTDARIELAGERRRRLALEEQVAALLAADRRR